MQLQYQLEKEVKKSPEERIATPDLLVDLQHQSIAQIIYEDNRVSTLCQLLICSCCINHVPIKRTLLGCI